ncbi:MAG: aldose epimerase family protein [Ilumatobacteraceae bacterium]
MTDIARERFGVLPDGRQVDRFVLRSRPLEVAVLTLGATLASVVMPDRDGHPADVVLGFDDLAGYVGPQAYLGATIGRFGNRIAGGRFVLDGETFTVPANEGRNALHGGPVGFDRAVWSAVTDGSSVRLTHTSPDGDQGFPGSLDVAVTYTLTPSGDRWTLRWDYEAHTDRPTVLNLTNHAYLNLAGSGTVEGHEVRIAAGRFVRVDGAGIPTGELAPVDGTPLDFRDTKSLGRDLRDGSPDLLASSGYDHSLVLDRPNAVQIREPVTGRTLEVWTDQPAVQLYNANHLDGTLLGRGGRTYRQGDAVCLETQHFPDSPNQPAFPSTVLRPGERFSSTTSWTMGIDR